MRHRRRIHTQTIQRRNFTPTSGRTPIKQGPGPLARFFRYLAFIIIVAGIAYVGYDYIWPLLQKPSGQAANEVPAGQGTDIPETETAPPLPVEDANTSAESSELTPIERKVQIEVLNGCGEQGIAKVLSTKLTANEYDVVSSSNYIKRGQANFDVPKTRIIDQLNTDKNYSQAEQLAGIMGIDAARIESVSNPSPIADITIIIGNDFTELPIFRED